VLDSKVFTVVKSKVEFFCVVTPCSVAVGYLCFRGLAYIYARFSYRHSLYPEDGGSMDLRNVDILPVMEELDL